MKDLTKCYLYFTGIFAFFALSIGNYFLTHGADGFRRLQSLSLDVQKFYCYREIYSYEECKIATANQPGMDEHC